MQVLPCVLLKDESTIPSHEVSLIDGASNLLHEVKVSPGTSGGSWLGRVRQSSPLHIHGMRSLGLWKSQGLQEVTRGLILLRLLLRSHQMHHLHVLYLPLLGTSSYLISRQVCALLQEFPLEYEPLPRRRDFQPLHKRHMVIVFTHLPLQSCPSSRSHSLSPA